MLRLVAVLLLFGCLAVEGNRCRYRELNRAPPLEVTRPRPRICRGSGSFIGDDYWTSIGYDGQIRDGRSRGDFLVFDQISNGYIAYWITRSKYGNVHYEAFGHAFVREDGRICAWFVGKDKEIVDVCGGFRILSRSRYNPSEPIPFEWILATPETHSRDTLGFHTHRIGKYSWQGENFYGDARLKDKNFQGVSPTSETFVEVTEPFDFERKIWLLRRKGDVSLTPPEPLRIEQPPQENGWRYADPHTQEGLVYPMAQDSARGPYAPSDTRDPRYYDPRYWFDRRNWKWINGQWSYDPGNYEYYEIDPQYQDARQQRRQRPQFYQVQDPRFKNDTVDTWNSQNEPSSQDRLAVPGYPYSDGKSESAARVVGDNEGWHVVGDSSGTPGVGEGAAPSSNIGHGVHPQGQGPVDNTQAGATAPDAADVQAGYYTDHYGRQIPVNTGVRQVGQGVAPGSGAGIGQGVHPQGEQPTSGHHQQTGGSVPHASDVQSGYYTDHYGRQVPVGGVNQVGTGAAPQPGVSLNQQEIVSYPDASRQLNVGAQGEQTGQHLARLHRPTIVKDEFGTIYHPTVVNGQVHYIPEKDQNQIVRPDPRLVSNPRITEDAQWRRQQEHMRIAEEERRLQEQAVRDRWANEQNKGQEQKEESQWKPVARTDEVRPEDVGQHEREEPVPFEKEDDEEPAVEQPAKLPTPRENPEEAVEDDEDDV